MGFKKTSVKFGLKSYVFLPGEGYWAILWNWVERCDMKTKSENLPNNSQKNIRNNIRIHVPMMGYNLHVFQMSELTPKENHFLI